MTTSSAPVATRRPGTPSRFGWATLAVVSLVLAVTLGIVTSGECYRGDCSVAYAGGPIGWIAISALVTQATWAGIRVFRPAPR